MDKVQLVVVVDIHLQTVTGWSFDKQGLSCQHSQAKCSMLPTEQIYQSFSSIILQYIQHKYNNG